MLQPNRTKYRKVHRGRMKGKETRGVRVDFGEFGLMALEPAWVNARQIEAARRAMVRFVKRGGKIWIRIFPDRIVTVKGAETRMGGGKGAPDHWVAVVRPGRVLFEIGGLKEDVAKEALRLASHKLPMKAQIVGRVEANQ